MVLSVHWLRISTISNESNCVFEFVFNFMMDVSKLANYHHHYQWKCYVRYIAWLQNKRKKKKMEDILFILVLVVICRFVPREFTDKPHSSLFSFYSAFAHYVPVCKNYDAGFGCSDKQRSDNIKENKSHGSKKREQNEKLSPIANSSCIFWTTEVW